MKLFQQLLVAPAALGLLVSGANAAELNINGVSDYAADASRCKDRHRRCWFACDWPSKSANGVVAPLSCVRN